MTSETYRSAMRVLIGERWEELWKAVPRAIDPSDSEGVHDVRVASRRLRAAMDIAASVFPAAWYPPLQRIAREITSELGAVRDREVMLEYLTTARNEAPPNEKPGIDRLIVRVEQERTAARAEMTAYLQELIDRNVRTETSRRFPVERTGGKTA